MMKSIWLPGAIVLLLLLSACRVIVPPEGRVQPAPATQTEQAPVAKTSDEAVMVAEESDSALTAAQKLILDNLPNHGPAPEIQNEVFLNSEALSLAGLRGKVVIVDFWTYG